jgi:hypothetical protein
MSDKHLIDMAHIWFSQSFGNRTVVQKRKCEWLGWYYLMQALMKDLHA